MVEPDYDFFATRPPDRGAAPTSPVAPSRLAAMPSPGPAPMSAWNPEPVLASAPPHAAPPYASASYPAAGDAGAGPRGLPLPAVLLVVAVVALVLASVAGAVAVLGQGG